MNTLELTFRHNNDVAQFELDVVGSNWDDVRILDRSEADKVVHGFILDCERWIVKLNQIAIHQMSVLESGDNDRKLLK